MFEFRALIDLFLDGLQRLPGRVVGEGAAQVGAKLGDRLEIGGARALAQRRDAAPVPAAEPVRPEIDLLRKNIDDMSRRLEATHKAVLSGIDQRPRIGADEL